MDAWASGDAYEPYVGRWSRLVARELLAWLAVPAGARWLDVGCGTGALTDTVLAVATPRVVVGVDRSAAFAAYARARITDPRASFVAADAQALPVADGGADAAVSGLVLNFVPDPARMLAAMRRAVRSAGIVAVYVWDHAGDMQLIRRFWDAAVALDARAVDLDEGRRFPITAPAPLTALFEAAGLADIATRAIDVPTVFTSFDDYWIPFTGGQGPAPGYCMSLPEPRRVALRERLRETLPTHADGSIALNARAWAVRGTVA